MNILEQEDIIKGLPDQALMKEASAPSGQVPQFLVVSEIKRRSDMRKRYQEQQQQPQGTVKDQIVMEAMGIGGVMPPQMAPQQPPMAPAGAPPMGGMPPMAPPMPQAGIASAPQGMPPMGMAQGGIVQMANRGQVPFLDQYVPESYFGPVQGGPTVRDQIDRLIESGMSAADLMAFATKTFRTNPEAIQYVMDKLRVARPDAETVGGMTARDVEAVEEAAPMRMMPKLAGGSDLYKAPMVLRAADALGIFDAYKSKPEDDRMLEPAASALAQQVADEYAVPDTSMRGIFRSPLSSDDLDFVSAPQRDRRLAPVTPTKRGQIPIPMDNASSGVADLFGTGFGGADYSSVLSEVDVPERDRSAVNSGSGVTSLPTNQDVAEAISRYMGRTAIPPAGDARVQATESAEVQGRASKAFTPSGSTLEEIAGSLYDYSPRQELTRRGPRRAEGSPSREDVIYDILGDDYSGFMPPVLPGPAARKKFIDEVVASRPDVLSQYLSGTADLFGTGFGGADYSQVAPDAASPATDAVTKEGQVRSDVADTVTAISNYPSGDRSNPFLKEAESTLNEVRKIVGDLPPASNASSENRALQSADMPALDFSDLISESKQQALANAMIQLGAGVASGDVAKGLSAAGTAAMKGTADARALDMKRRLAEYQAGREDIRRGEETRRYEEGMKLKREQFDTRLQFDMAKLDAEISQSDEVTRRSLITSIPDLIREANDEIGRLQQFGGDEAALERIADLQGRIESLYKQYEKYSTMPSRGKNRFSGYSLVGQR